MSFLKVSSFFSPLRLSCLLIISRVRAVTFYHLSPITNVFVTMRVRLRVNVLKGALVCACVTTCRKSPQSERTYSLAASWLYQMWQFSPSSCFTFLFPLLLAPAQPCQASLGPHTLKCGSAPTDSRVWLCAVSVFVSLFIRLTLRCLTSEKLNDCQLHICHSIF